MVRGKLGRQAAVYPFKLCRAILEGARQQLRQDDRLEDGVYCIMPDPSENMTDKQLERRVCRKLNIEIPRDLAAEGENKEADDVLNFDKGSEKFVDSVTGQPLIPEMVRAARGKRAGIL